MSNSNILANITARRNQVTRVTIREGRCKDAFTRLQVRLTSAKNNVERQAIVAGFLAGEGVMDFPTIIVETSQLEAFLSANKLANFSTTTLRELPKLAVENGKFPAIARSVADQGKIGKTLEACSFAWWSGDHAVLATLFRLGRYLYVSCGDNVTVYRLKTSRTYAQVATYSSQNGGEAQAEDLVERIMGILWYANIYGVAKGAPAPTKSQIRRNAGSYTGENAVKPKATKPRTVAWRRRKNLVHAHEKILRDGNVAVIAARMPGGNAYTIQDPLREVRPSGSVISNV